MLDYLRLFAAFSLFVIGCYLMVDLVLHGFDLAVLLVAMLSFLLAHYVRPKSAARDGADAWEWFDIIDLIVDIPFRAIAFALRAIAAVLRKGSLDID